MAVRRMLRPFGRLRQASPAPHHYDMLIIVILGSVAFFYLALGSFHPYDESWFAAARPPQAAQNTAGLVGAYLASFALYQLGLASYALPLPVLLFSALRYIARRELRLLSFACGGVLFVLAQALALARFVPLFLTAELPMPGGGVLGRRLLALVHRTLGEQGGAVVAASLLGLSLVLMIKKSVLYEGLFPFLRRCCSPLLGWSGRLLAPLRRSLQAVSLYTRTLWRRRFKALSLPRTLNDQQRQAGSTPFLANEPALLPELGLADPSPLASKLAPLEASRLNRLGAVFQPSAQAQREEVDPAPLHAMQGQLLAALHDFKIAGEVVDFQRGPLVTTYAFKPDKGIKQATIVNLINDLALALKLDSLFVHPIPEKSALGFQLPNHQRETVRFADFVHARTLHDESLALPLALGKNIYGEVVTDDLAAMPHLLIAGSTGSGKSVGIHSFICSLLVRLPPTSLRLLLVDPKMLELTYYEGLPHLLQPVITDPDLATQALAGAIAEMELRYKIMQAAKVRHIADFNQFWHHATTEQRFNLLRVTGLPAIDYMPYHVIVIDELADLMMTAAKDIETMIARLAQKARASGIHMILATQRPSVDVITGTIKANFPSRLTYRLVSSHDSRTIIDQPGAEKLLGRGDLLFHKPGASRLIRLHSPFITDAEIKALTELLKREEGPAPFTPST